MKHPALAFLNALAWAWFALSVFRWIERFAGIVGATLRSTLGF
jgi:hypothetical protein